MHRQAGPRANIDVAVMQGMYVFVEEWHVEQAMHPVEMEGGPDREQDKRNCEPDRIAKRRNCRGVTVCHEPHRQNGERSEKANAGGE